MPDFSFREEEKDGRRDNFFKYERTTKDVSAGEGKTKGDKTYQSIRALENKLPTDKTDLE